MLYMDYIVAVLLLYFQSTNAFPDKAGMCEADPVAMAASEMGPTVAALEFSASIMPSANGATVTINGKTKFRGLLLYVQDSTGKHVGAFNPPPGFQTLDRQCSQFPPGSTLSHSSSTFKNPGLQFQWISNGAQGPLTLTGIIVGGEANEWQIISPVQFSSQTLAGNGMNVGTAVNPANIYPNMASAGGPLSQRGATAETVPKSNRFANNMFIPIADAMNDEQLTSYLTRTLNSLAGILTSFGNTIAGPLGLPSTPLPYNSGTQRGYTSDPQLYGNMGMKNGYAYAGPRYVMPKYVDPNIFRNTNTPPKIIDQQPYNRNGKQMNDKIEIPKLPFDQENTMAYNKPPADNANIYSDLIQGEGMTNPPIPDVENIADTNAQNNNTDGVASKGNKSSDGMSLMVLALLTYIFIHTNN
jgi:hypothetical protein